MHLNKPRVTTENDQRVLFSSDIFKYDMSATQQHLSFLLWEDNNCAVVFCRLISSCLVMRPRSTQSSWEWWQPVRLMFPRWRNLSRLFVRTDLSTGPGKLRVRGKSHNSFVKCRTMFIVLYLFSSTFYADREFIHNRRKAFVIAANARQNIFLLFLEIIVQ